MARLPNSAHWLVHLLLLAIVSLVYHIYAVVVYAAYVAHGGQPAVRQPALSR